MRTIFLSALMLLVSAPVLAQESPEQSYQAFIDAVLSDDVNDLERTAMFERYFDFEAWIDWDEDQNGHTYAPEQRAQLRDEWFELFRSDTFRDTYESSNVQVVEELSRDEESGTAELLISMDGDNKTEKFRVLMKLSEDATHWRWYAIPKFVDDQVPAEQQTPVERLAAIEEQLKAIEDRQAELEELRRQLLEEARKLRAELVEADADESPYGSPQKVVETAWKAIEDDDANALVECHVFREGTQEKVESGELKKKVSDLNARLMSWEVLDTRVDDENPLRAHVRVRLKMQKTGSVDDRTITVKVRRVGEEWKIDEEP